MDHQRTTIGSSSFSSYFHVITRALHWDRGRPARSERAARTERFEVDDFARSSHLAVLVVGEPPAVPVKSLSGQVQLVLKRNTRYTPLVVT
jgi:hypothetical protein